VEARTDRKIVFVMDGPRVLGVGEDIEFVSSA
jgi:hypothetical protein